MEDKEVCKSSDEKLTDCKKKTSEKKRKWEKPKLDDVSGKVMAQPYIRFT